MMSNTETRFTAIDGDTAPEDFVILSARALTPDDITTTPPVTAKLFMSPEFTNPEGEDADSGRTRDYVVVLDYPEGVDNTVVRMDDVSTVHGSRIFRKFVEDIADEKGYTSEVLDITEFF